MLLCDDFYPFLSPQAAEFEASLEKVKDALAEANAERDKALQAQAEAALKARFAGRVDSAFASRLVYFLLLHLNLDWPAYTALLQLLRIASR